jgi:hypothetical protein
MTLLNPKLAPRLPPEERNVPYKTCLMALLTSFAPLGGLIGAALGSIIFGLATPSEAAAMGSLGALLLAVAYGADYTRWPQRADRPDLRPADRGVLHLPDRVRLHGMERRPTHRRPSRCSQPSPSVSSCYPARHLRSGSSRSPYS